MCQLALLNNMDLVKFLLHVKQWKLFLSPPPPVEAY